LIDPQYQLGNVLILGLIFFKISADIFFIITMHEHREEKGLLKLVIFTVKNWLFFFSLSISKILMLFEIANRIGFYDFKI